MTTNTLDTTRLSEDQLDTIWQRMHFDVSWALTWAEDIIASHRTLAADLARVEAERDRYREALHEIVHGLDDYDDVYAAERYEYWYIDMNDIARAALNGDTDAE